MKYKLAAILFLALSFQICYSQRQVGLSHQRIVIESVIPESFHTWMADHPKNGIPLESANPDYITPDPSWTVNDGKVKGNKVTWILYSNNPVAIRIPFLIQSAFVCPGDSISLYFEGKEPVYSGKGSEGLNLQRKLELYHKNLPEPTPKGYVVLTSVEDYLKWDKFLDEQSAFIIPLLDSYKKRISPSLYDLIKKNELKYIEHQRAESLLSLNNRRVLYKNSGITPNDMITLADTKLDKSQAVWLRNQSEHFGDHDVWYFFQYNRIQIAKKVGFDFTNDSLDRPEVSRLLFYQTLKQRYKGLLRERLLQYLIAERVIKKMGYMHPLTSKLLKDYYSQPGFPEYKQWMRNFEIKARKLYNYNSSTGGNLAPDFQLVDTKGNVFTKSDLKGKIVLLDFWFSGCKGCVDMAPQLRKIEEEFKNDPSIAFVSISTDQDKDRWLLSIAQKKYTSGGGINLYTGGQGMRHQMLKDYNITSYPELYLLNTEGEIAQYPLPNPRGDNGLALINLIKKKRAELNDGPYILYEKTDTMSINYINPLTGRITEEKQIAPLTLSIGTDKYPETFSVQLKTELQNEPSIYNEPSKQLVVSDIEGNFEALRKLLQASKVIDSKYNWIFGNGHLVFVGDMFDRGQQVTECLWLIYSLEEKAKKAGGYIHFILGNHEILNLCGDFRYTQKKYTQNAKLLNEDYKSLYGCNSELGRWLRTKNIMEKIGNILYTHGGISREVNNLSLTLPEINALIRPYYADRDNFKQNKKNPELNVLFNSQTSPFWYRGYYKNENQIPIIDSTLQKFGVRRVITGHTIIADTISLHHNGKVIDIDTHHADGKSEALLIEDENFYRITPTGEKVLLLKNDKLFAIRGRTN